MESQKQQVVERLQQANNILVTVSSNPSVDQLAACIGLTLTLNKLGKHATAVFSGTVPSTIEFLQPEKTIEKNTDSLRDFIIALDKSKADKLRYKVEDRMVKIFITPYRTSITGKDLDFSQGDFNVDVVVAIGVHAQNDLDQAITAHGRILHDATVMTMNVKPGGELGSVNWLDVGASSLSELGVQLINDLDPKLMDGQIATAFLTGIVAETERFSNNKTSPQTMSISAELMSAGANQQLVATKLEEPAPAPQPAPIPQLTDQNSPAKAPEAAEPPKPDDGTIEIAHDGEKSEPEFPGEIPEPPKPESEDEPEAQAPQIHIDDQGQLRPFGEKHDETPTAESQSADDEILPPVAPLPGIKRDEGSRLLTDPEPALLSGSPLTANALPNDEDEPSTDPLSLPSVGLLNREPLPSQQGDRPNSNPINVIAPPAPAINPAPSFGQEPHFNNPGVSPLSGGQPFTPPQPMDNTTKTLSQLEEDVKSPHLAPPAPSTPFAPPAPAINPAPVFQPPTPTVVTPTEKPIASVSNEATDVDAARNAVEQAINSNPESSVEPIQALNAQPMGASLHNDPSAAPAPVMPDTAGMINPSAPQQPVTFEPTLPQQDANNPQTPPPVPPPMMPPTFPTPSH